MHVCKCVPRMYVYTVDIQLNLRLRRFRSLAFAAMDHDLGRRMFKALCGGKIRSQYGGWVKRRALAQFLQVREEAIAKIVDGTASIRNDEGKPYFETELDERRHVCIKANASLEEMALLGVLQPVSEVQDLEADAAAGTPPGSSEDNWGTKWPGPAPKEAACHSEPQGMVAEPPCDGTRPSHAEEVRELRVELAAERALREEVQHECELERHLRSQMQEMQAEHSQARLDATEQIDMVIAVRCQRQKLEQLEGQPRPKAQPASARAPAASMMGPGQWMDQNLEGPSPMMGQSPMMDPRLSPAMMGRSPNRMVTPPLLQPPSLDSVLALEAALRQRAMEEEGYMLARAFQHHRQLEEGDALEAEIMMAKRQRLGPSPGMPPPGPGPGPQTECWHASSMGPSPGMPPGPGPQRWPAAAPPSMGHSVWTAPPSMGPPPQCHWHRNGPSESG